MLGRKKPKRLVNPNVGILNLGGDEMTSYIRSDIDFLHTLFADVQTLELARPKCDILFLYVRMTIDAVVGPTNRFREIIRDSGAKIVVVASPNSGKSYINADKPLSVFGKANLIMTLDRRGDMFANFFTELLSKMKNGIPMPVAWAQISPQGGAENLNSPSAIFSCEVGPIVID